MIATESVKYMETNKKLLRFDRNFIDEFNKVREIYQVFPVYFLRLLCVLVFLEREFREFDQ